MITLTQLEYIVAVEKFRNFGQAAKSCFVTQPTLSMQIQKLEDFLGVTVFDRSKQPVQPTPIGQKILDQSRMVLTQSAQITELINQEKETVEGDLRVAIIPTLAPYLLPLFVKELATQFPKIQLSVEESKTDDIIIALQRNQIDVGLLVTPLNEPTLSEVSLFQEAFYAYVEKSSPLAKLREIEEKDLLDQELLLLTEGHCMRDQSLRICGQRRMKGDKDNHLRFESGSIETLCHLVEKGMGYTIIPHLAKEWMASRPGKVVPFAEPSPSREVSLVVHRSYLKKSLINALSHCILKTLPQGVKKPHRDLRTVRLR